MEDITRSWESDRDLPNSEDREDGEVSVSDWEIVSDEHSAVGDEVKAVVDDAAGVFAGMLGCVGGKGAVSLLPALACCCSHIVRVLGSTGQLEVSSRLFDGGGGGEDACRPDGDGEEA
jgi:hypothetical protein